MVSSLRRLPVTLLCACALLAAAAGCNRDTAPAQQAAANAPSTGAATGQPPVPAPEAPGQPAASASVPADGQPPLGTGPNAAPAAGLAPREQDVANRERQLAARQAVLDARERKLDQRQGVPPATMAPRADAPPPAAFRGGDPRPDVVRTAGPRTGFVVLPAGTHLEVELTTGLSSHGSRVGERVRGRVIDPVQARGLVAIPAGSEVIGVVTQASSARRFSGSARLGLRFTELVLPSGATVPIRASFAEAGRSKGRRSAATIGGSAAGGALLGNLIDRRDRTKGTVIGALVGAGVGTAIAANTPGKPVVVPRGSVVRLRLRSAVEVPVYSR